MTVGTEACTYWQELQSYDAAAERDGTDHTHPAKPPTADVAFDVSAICAESIALLLDNKTGKFPTGSNADPSPNLSLRPAGSSIGRCRSGGICWGTGSSVRRGPPSRRST